VTLPPPPPTTLLKDAKEPVLTLICHVQCLLVILVVVKNPTSIANLNIFESTVFRHCVIYQVWLGQICCNRKLNDVAVVVQGKNSNDRDNNNEEGWWKTVRR
jgi:hypothetical protein